MVAVDNFALELLPGKIHKPDLFDRFFNRFQEPTTIEIEGVKIESSPNEEWQEDSTRAKLIYDDKPLRTEVEGIELRAQFRSSTGYVLFTAYDWFDGTDTRIYFLTADFEIRDEIFLGTWSRPVPGFAADFQIASENQIDFSIYEDDRTWQLTVFDPPCRTFFDASFAETNRPLRWLLSEHYLKLETK